jgi:hypothetical protein
MIDKLIVDGFTLDLADKVAIPISLSIADRKDPSQRKRNFSKQIDIPATAKNMLFFSGTFSLTVNDLGVNFDATQKSTAVYEKNGVSILKNAILKLDDVTMLNEEVFMFKCTLLSESIDYFLLLSTISVSELDWSEYNHALTRANIIASFTAATGSGYYYPLIERGIPRIGTTTWRTTDMIPYVYEREVLIKMFEWAGIPLTSALFETDLFKQYVWGYGGGILPTLSSIEQDKRLINLDSGDYQENLSPSFWTGTTIRTYFFYQNTNPFRDAVFTSTITQDDLLQFDNGEITVQYSGNYNITLAMSLSYQVNLGAYTLLLMSGLKLIMYKNGLPVNYMFSIGEQIVNPAGTGTLTLNTNLSKALTLQSGDVLSFGIYAGDARVTSPSGVFTTSINVDISINTPITIDFVSTDTTITDGGTVVLSNYLPEMKCSDFLLGSIRQHNLDLSEPDEDGVVTIESLNEFYQPTSTFDDWSELVDHEKTFVVSPTANDYKKNIQFIFKDSKDFDSEQYLNKYNQRYGDLDYEQGSYFAKGIQKIELPWSMGIPYEIAPNILVPRFIKITDGGAVTPNKGASRLMLRNGQKTGAWTLIDSDGSGLSSILTEYPCVHHFDDYQNPVFDMSFKLVEELFYIASVVTNLNSFSSLYFEYINEMTNVAGKLATGYFKLDSYIVNNIDFSKLKMINGSLWRLNQVIDFDDNVQETTKVELIKVLKAKSPKRKQLIFKPKPPIIGSGIFSSPDGVGVDVVVISGGAGAASSSSPIIYG